MFFRFFFFLVSFSVLFVRNPFQITLLGPPRTGKTASLSQYIHKHFLSFYIPTVGVDVFGKRCSGDKVSLKLWDTSGQDRFRLPVLISYRYADALIFFYDKTSKSFVNSYFAFSCCDSLVFLCGTKTDLVSAVYTPFWCF